MIVNAGMCYSYLSMDTDCRKKRLWEDVIVSIRRVGMLLGLQVVVRLECRSCSLGAVHNFDGWHPQVARCIEWLVGKPG